MSLSLLEMPRSQGELVRPNLFVVGRGGGGSIANIARSGAAVEISHNEMIDNIIFAGNRPYWHDPDEDAATHRSEADDMHANAVSLGLKHPHGKIHIEADSRSFVENIYNNLEVLRDNREVLIPVHSIYSSRLSALFRAMMPEHLVKIYEVNNEPVSAADRGAEMARRLMTAKILINVEPGDVDTVVRREAEAKASRLAQAKRRVSSLGRLTTRTR